jgi:hypothetical protein
MKHGTHPTGSGAQENTAGEPPICLPVRGSNSIGDSSLLRVYLSVDFRAACRGMTLVDVVA